MKRARTILSDPGHGALADWPEKVKIVPRSQPLLAPEITEPVMSVVYEALLRNRRFKGIYKRQGEEGRELEVSPLGLVFNDPVVYIVGTCWDYTDVRLLSLHRFSNAELQETQITRPEKFDLQSYIDSGSLGFTSALGFTSESGIQLRLSARFTISAAVHLRECRLSRDQTISDDQEGWVRVDATVADTYQLRWWLLGFGAQVEILEPKELREEIKITLCQLANLYDVDVFVLVQRE